MDTPAESVESLLGKAALGHFFWRKKLLEDTDFLYRLGAELMDHAIQQDPQVLDRMGLPAICALNVAITVGEDLYYGDDTLPYG